MSSICGGVRRSCLCSLPLRRAKNKPQQNTMVSRSCCGVESPSWSLSQSFSSSSWVITSACRFFAPSPHACSRFISPSRLAWKGANCRSLNRSTILPLKRCRPATMWCSVFGGYSVPSTFRTSTTNLLSQCVSSVCVIVSMDGMFSPVCVCLYSLHVFHSL